MIPTWMVWFLAFGNLVNLAFDGTIIVRCLIQHLRRLEYEKMRGIVRHPKHWWSRA